MQRTSPYSSTRSSSRSSASETGSSLQSLFARMDADIFGPGMRRPSARVFGAAEHDVVEQRKSDSEESDSEEEGDFQAWQRLEAKIEDTSEEDYHPPQRDASSSDEFWEAAVQLGHTLSTLPEFPVPLDMQAPSDLAEALEEHHQRVLCQATDAFCWDAPEANTQVLQSTTMPAKRLKSHASITSNNRRI